MNCLKRTGVQYSTRAQVKMFETVAILIVFIMLFVFGISFYFFIQKSLDAQETDEQLEIHAIRLSQLVINMPEFECSIGKAQHSQCIDLYRTKAFGAILDDSLLQEYFNIMEYSLISLEVYYPPQYAQNITLYNHTSGGQYIQTIFPVKVYDLVENNFAYGMLRVKRYA